MIDENDDNEEIVIKDNTRLKKTIQGFNEMGNNYFKHCKKEKIETISRWCSQLKNHGFGMGRNLQGNEDYENKS